LNVLDNVSCTSPKACMAVGYRYRGSFESLTEVWNGKRWSIEP
jgi:hypothetical protein